MPHLDAVPSQNGQGAVQGSSGAGNYKHGARSKETIQLWKLVKSLK
jgi:hypothetical protein